MATEIDKSIKLVFNEFQKSISEVPLEVYYQTLVSDQYSANGYQFNIKQPGSRALLDTDIWIEYNLQLIETVNYGIRGGFEQSATGNPASALFWPDQNQRLSLRGANVMQRATTNLNLQINNQTLNVRPIQWIDEINRLYVSNDQAEHEFSPSGGRFDEGNHGVRCYPRYRSGTNNIAGNVMDDFTSQIPDGWGAIINAQAADGNTHFDAVWSDAWAIPYQPVNGGSDVMINIKPDFPHQPEYYNPGFENRFFKFSKVLRDNLLEDNAAAAATNDNNQATQFIGTALAGNIHLYNIRVLERLPIPLFKMYSNDEVFGVIPNVYTMQLQGIFASNLEQMIFRFNRFILNAQLYWANIRPEGCKLYLRWFTPPMSMAIPQEIHIPYKKIVNWSKAVSMPQMHVNGDQQYVEQAVQEYNVSLEAIPDLLLIYMKFEAAQYNYTTPDDYNLEMRDLNINIDNASGKVNQIQSIDLYNKWKKLLKHSDNKIIEFDEWRRYCCIAALQPEDYGVRYGPGYSNQTILGIKFTARNWHSNPSIMAELPEVLGGYDTVAVNTDTTHCELNVTAIYYKNRLALRSDGSASQELTKVAADFGMVRAAEGLGGMSLGQGGAGMMNA